MKTRRPKCISIWKIETLCTKYTNWNVNPMEFWIICLIVEIQSKTFSEYNFVFHSTLRKNCWYRNAVKLKSLKYMLYIFLINIQIFKNRFKIFQFINIIHTSLSFVHFSFFILNFVLFPLLLSAQSNSLKKSFIKQFILTFLNKSIWKYIVEIK